MDSTNKYSLKYQLTTIRIHRVVEATLFMMVGLIAGYYIALKQIVAVYY